MPLIKDIKKVMVIGSGPIVIGQAAEFDYAGTQACRVLKDRGINVVLVNSNPATIMTDSALADEIYLEPITSETIKRIIEKERPDGLLAGFGGQNGLTLAMELDKEGYFEKMGVRLLGTDAKAIDRAEDRKLFKETMDALNQPTIPSDIANDVETALDIAARIGYPVIVRPAFTLGGAGGGVGYTEEELRQVAETGLEASPIHQVLIEKYIYGWKEIEFEVIRDGCGNCIAVCSMENFDPVGVHTGDSIVIAPAVTLSNREYQMLRTAALTIVDGLGVVGGCNCQFALDPDSFDYAVIEVNPRVSRSSALASKATGYPIAKVAAQIALGYNLDEIKNEITGRTCACFEPALDYVVVKLPRWPFDKFAGANRSLGTQMKATGEVMSIADSFEMALMKAVRGAEISLDTLNRQDTSGLDVISRIKKCDDNRLFNLFEAIKAGHSIEELHEITRIDRWFLTKLAKLAEFEGVLARGNVDDELYFRAKKLGYTDAAIKRISGCAEIPHLDPVYRMVDTCAAEFDAVTPYFYGAYGGQCEARALDGDGKRRIMVLGSGPIRIGQGIEFDYSSVHCVRTLRSMGFEVIIVNNNPETVSTDYDTADKLYFEPLTVEDVMGIIEAEKPEGVVVAFGGQTAIKLTGALDRAGIKILGTSAEGIDLAEDRARFDALLESMGISRPAGQGVESLEGALKAAGELGYPVLLRPSYVIGGQNMRIAHNDDDVRAYMEVILSGGIDNPVLVDKYMQGPELEVDCISDGRDVLIPGIMEHVERAGVHSGDSIAVYPPYNLDDAMLRKVIDNSMKLALALGTKGLVNIQYLIWHNELYVIEVNPRASRTIPYISKVTGVPMVDIASRVMLGEKLADLGYSAGLYRTPPYYAVKVPVFSFGKLTGANAVLGPEMKSTGEVLGVARSLPEALFKGLRAAGIRVPDGEAGYTPGALLSVDEHEHYALMNLAKKLHDRNIRMYATSGTAKAISAMGIEVTSIGDIGKSGDAFRLIDQGRLAFIVYTGAMYDSTTEDYAALNRYALNHSIACFTSMDTANAMADVIAGRYNTNNTELVDICNMRTQRQQLKFVKMQDLGNDYIVIENLDGAVSCPESLALQLCDRHLGVGADGLAVIEKSEDADLAMRMFNRDGSEGMMAVNCLRYVGKYAYDRGIVPKEQMTVQTAKGVRRLSLVPIHGEAGSVSVEVGTADFTAKNVPVKSHSRRVIDTLTTIGGRDYRITCLSMGNPHCVVFTDSVDSLDLNRIGPQFEYDPMFPERVNAEFVHVVDEYLITMRVWERGSGETQACGSGACAAVAAATELGLCKKDTPVTVKLTGGDLQVVCASDGRVTITGGAETVYEGIVKI